MTKIKPTNKTFFGRRGEGLVMVKLGEMGIDSMPTPSSWPFDLITETGLKIEVKHANPTTTKGGSGYAYENFVFNIKEKQINILDFAILIANTKEGKQFYIIPRKAITCLVISFTPFSSNRKSKYLKYKDAWHLIKNYKP